MCNYKYEKYIFPFDYSNGNYFNPTIYSTALNDHMIYRFVGEDLKRKLQKCVIDRSTLNVTNEEDLKLGESSSGCNVNWCADPRVFNYDNKIFVTYNTGHSESPNQIYIQEIDDKFSPKSDPILLIKKDGRRKVEKNWGFFQWDHKLYAIYSVSPFVILKVKIDHNANEAVCTEAYHHQWQSKKIEESFGELRGGASPIKINNQLYYIVQSNKWSSIGFIYTGSIITFAADPPFKPLSVTPNPIFCLSKNEYFLKPKNKLNKKIEACLYPTGATFDKNNSLLGVSYGINDSYCGYRSVSLQTIDEMLIEINSLSE